jgi:hypothetical protein
VPASGNSEPVSLLEALVVVVPVVVLAVLLVVASELALGLANPRAFLKASSCALKEDSVLFMDTARI